jgi:2-phosphosulfolactate phosphatase
MIRGTFDVCYDPRMPRSIHVALLPDQLTPEQLRGSIAVVIDVLRASTTIVHALAHGATLVAPFETVESAKIAASSHARDSTLLAGERGGVAIDGFDLGNSPLACSAETVDGKSIIFTTTNGTRALAKSRSANRILIGAFVNQAAIVNELTPYHGNVILVCAGTDGQISAEDVLFAGSLTWSLNHVWGSGVTLDDPARIAMDFFRANSENHARLLAAVRESRGGQNLIRLGFDDDIECAASLDLFSTVPEYNVKTNELKVACR